MCLLTPGFLDYLSDATTYLARKKSRSFCQKYGQYAPSMESLTGLHRKQWKEVDLKRMEERVLRVLEREIPRCTYLSFLDSIMKVVKQCRCSVLPSRQVIQKAESCLMEEFTFMFTVCAGFAFFFLSFRLGFFRQNG